MTNQPLHQPIIFDKDADNKELMALSKSNEEKKYYVLYTDNVNGQSYFEVFTGRTACYRGIERILKSYEDGAVDAGEMLVLVEVIGIDRKTNEYRTFLMNPDDPNCLTGYDFCKLVENQFPDSFDVEDYTAEIPVKENDNQVKYSDISTGKTINVELFGNDAVVANEYAAIAQERVAQIASETAQNLFKTSGVASEDLFKIPDNSQDNWV